MTKSQKTEWLLSTLLIPLFFFALYEGIKNLDLFGSRGPAASEIVSYILLLGTLAAFFINYIVKIILAFISKRYGRKVLLIWCLGPVVITLGTLLLINGAFSFNADFVFLNILSIIGVLLMIGVYNVFYFYYWGEHKGIWISQIIYNIGAIALAISEWAPHLIHNFYLGLLLPAIAVGYIEFYLKKKKEP